MSRAGSIARGSAATAPVRGSGITGPPASGGIRPGSGSGPGILRTAIRQSARPRLSPLTPAWLCVFAALALSVLGLMAIGTVAPAEQTTQLVFLCLGVVAAAVAAAFPYRLLEPLSVPIMLVVLGMLVFVLLPFVPESLVRPRNGARRWISLGVDVQPSELCKIAYVVTLSAYLVHARHYRRFFGIFKPMALTFIPMALILKEPDLGTSLLFLPTLFAMLLAAGSRIRHLVLIVILGLSPTPLLYGQLAPHQKERIDALVAQWKGETHLQQDEGYQGMKALMLTGSGGATGLGREDAATLVVHNRLPEDHNDMIFAVISARWGFLGAVMTWGLFLALALGAILTAAQTSDPFGRLVAIGIGTLLFVQMVVNTGMTIGVLPITGMTLPFVSYGGSSLISAWAMIGILVSIGVRWPQHLARAAVDFDTFETQEDG